MEKPRKRRLMEGLCRYSINAVIMLLALLCSATTAWSAIVIQDVTPVDVTPSGFSIIWQSSEPAVPGIAIYSDAGGTNEITNELEITPFPLYGGDPENTDEYQNDLEMDNIRNLAITHGLTKIGIHGCLPDTTYYYRVYAKGTGNEVASWPADGLASVTTMVENAFVNDSRQILLTLTSNEGVLNAKGLIVIASTGMTLYPISTIVGDGTGTNQAFLNIANLFGQDGRNWTPTGTMEVSLEVIGLCTDPIQSTSSVEFTDDFHVSTVHGVEITVVDLPEMGDLDGDCNVDLYDAIIALQILSKIRPSSPINTIDVADINGDGRIGIEEAIYALQNAADARNQ